MVLSLSMLIFSGQLEGFLFFTELYHFHGILNCLSADCHLASFEWYDPYQQCYDALLKYTNPSENILIEIMEISALHAELHNDGFNNRNVMVVICERYATRVFAVFNSKS
ncbi:hypothetical protein OUZ56_024821 [Daphnia magna]|uniref:Uncharacterized protein n=1 Tax=Daphnia magna TaxID=35525 RepID=A0ABQ9ZI40_9CRUS|nr:hypothetical protein OUZ56_024821 [Daphnia magna]